MRYYVYKVTFPTLPNYYYIGYHKDGGKAYYGTPVTNSIVWEFHSPQVEILKWFDTQEEAVTAEYDLLECWKDPYCLNENRGGHISVEICREQGLRNYEFNFSTEIRRENGRASGIKNAPNLLQYAAENGSRNGPENIKVVNSDPRKSKWSAEGGSKTGAENGRRGLAKMPRERRSQNGQNTLKEHGGRISKLGAAAANSQKWKSTIDDYVSTAAGVANHNRNRGWDPEARVRL